MGMEADLMNLRDSLSQGMVSTLVGYNKQRTMRRIATLPTKQPILL
jgi:hypothetical protein